MATYILTGDIRHAGRVRVEATTPEEALDAAAAGTFAVVEEAGRNLAFEFCGDEEGGVEVV
jgi:uncharacterized membrane protein